MVHKSKTCFLVDWVQCICYITHIMSLLCESKKIIMIVESKQSFSVTIQGRDGIIYC